MPASGIQNSLKERGIRLTRQRRILARSARPLRPHLNADTLYQLAKEKDPKLNRVTVYRTLKLLKKGGLIDELDLMHVDGDQHYYESRLKQEHAHLICLRCGKVEEFFGEPLQKMRTPGGGATSASRSSPRAPKWAAIARIASRRLAQEAAGRRAPQAGCPNVHAAVLLVLAPSGQRQRAALDALPFTIGRQAGNSLVLRDNRASRNHCRIVFENGSLCRSRILNSRHGTWVNGAQIARHVLHSSDRIEFGIRDSYQLTFSLEKAGNSSPAGTVLLAFEIQRARPARRRDLIKLRSLMEVARALQNSLSIEDVLTAVVDAALAVTGCERGFLLLRPDRRQNRRSHRHGGARQPGQPLEPGDLRVPSAPDSPRAGLAARSAVDVLRSVRAAGRAPGMTVAQLELRSVVCLPLIRLRSGSAEDTRAISASEDTVGLLYMDSRVAPADLSSGNRELLQTLAIEASTILENARLLEEERGKLRMEDELKIAREIQQGLQPPSMPQTGWFRAAGSSTPSTQVGGDYFDVHQISPDLLGRGGGRRFRQGRQFGVAGQPAAGNLPDGDRRSGPDRAAHGAPQRIPAGADARAKSTPPSSAAFSKLPAC